MRRPIKIVLLVAGMLGVFLAFAAGAAAQTGTTPGGAPPAVVAPLAPVAAALKVDSGDTAWLLTSSALVLLMTPGLAFFYGGLV
ncbi:MAG: ammonium transporter, Amt family, partial [Chloroflexota bacterium]|nr:ammonium transporter, Amt family [Chloroflexota bacterium]MEA2639587.1 ammonium transporter, Amt family [Chloroflexota bacterium]